MKLCPEDQRPISGIYIAGMARESAGGLAVGIDCDSRHLARSCVTQNRASWRCLIPTSGPTFEQLITPCPEREGCRDVCFDRDQSSRGRRHPMFPVCSVMTRQLNINLFASCLMVTFKPTSSLSAEGFASPRTLQFIALLRKTSNNSHARLRLILLWVNALILGKLSSCKSFRCTQQCDKNWNVSADKVTTISYCFNRTCGSLFVHCMRQ